MSGRLHKSPPVVLTKLRGLFPWYEVDTLQGEIAIDNGGTVTAAIEFPLGTPPGAARAFKFRSSFIGSLFDFSTLQSDALSCRVPPDTLYRLRCFTDPAGFAPIGRPSLGTEGGSMAAYGGAVDTSEWSAFATDRTQSAAEIRPYRNDSAYEPILVGQTDEQIDSWMLIGDSITVGNADISGSSGASDPGAGDHYGNAGYAERAFGIKNVPYVNLAKSGSRARIWATSASNIRIYSLREYCNKGLLNLGRNDLGAYRARDIIEALIVVYRTLTSFLSRVVVCTIVPATRTIDGGATIEGQTTHSYEQDRLDVNAFIRSGVIIPVADVFDLESIVRDREGKEVKWRVDGGPWSATGLHPTRIAHIAAAKVLAAML